MSLDSVSPSETLSKEETVLHTLADELLRAERSRQPIEPITERHPGFDVDAAYEVQSLIISRRRATGNLIIGQKVGLTSAAMQQQLGVEEPDYGRLLDDMRIEAGGQINLEQLIQPRIEPEVAFVLRRDLEGPGRTIEDVLSLTEAIMPALEIIDSRIAGWRIRLPDTVADNASSARFVVGSPAATARLDLAELHGLLLADGEPVGRGRGADVLGHPAAPVAWLANTLAAYGESLRGGQVILPGSVCPSVPLVAGQHYTAQFDAIGRVDVTVGGAS